LKVTLMKIMTNQKFRLVRIFPTV